MPTTRRTVLGALGLLAAPGLMRSAWAAPHRLTVASLLGPDKPETQIWLHIRNLVERERPGAFRFNIVPNAALGGERQVLEGMRLGSIQAGLATAASLATWVPACEALDLPFAFRDGAHLHRVMAGEIGQSIAAGLSESGFEAPAFVDYGPRNLLARSALPLPEAMRGRRIRVIDNALHRRLWQAFGAVPAAIPIPETYNALGNGVVDTMDLTLPASVGFKLYEVAPVTTETRHIRAAGAVLFSAAFWARLDGPEKTLLTRAALDGAVRFATLLAEQEAAGRAEAISAGGRFVPAEAPERWEAIARTIWPATAGAWGGMARLEALLR
jgi:TRAP-type C4-dicarboxylate transport system substrate-binding protein